MFAVFLQLTAAGQVPGNRNFLHPHKCTQALLRSGEEHFVPQILKERSFKTKWTLILWFGQYLQQPCKALDVTKPAEVPAFEVQKAPGIREAPETTLRVLPSRDSSVAYSRGAASPLNWKIPRKQAQASTGHEALYCYQCFCKVCCQEWQTSVF